MLTGEVFDQPRHAHPPASETADYLIQPVTHLTADEHRLAVCDSGNLQIRGAILLQRESALFAADASGNSPFNGYFRFNRSDLHILFIGIVGSSFILLYILPVRSDCF